MRAGFGAPAAALPPAARDAIALVAIVLWACGAPPKKDFDHPALALDHRLARHVPYRLARPASQG